MAKAILLEDHRKKKEREAETITLDRETFIRLDAAARAKAGLTIHMAEPEELGPNFAVLPGMSLDHYIDARRTTGRGCKREKRGLLLANKVNLAKFWATPRPELDYSAIPAEVVFDFLVWHEIGHFVKGPDMLLAYVDHGCHPGTRKGWLAYFLTEVRADRYAWGVAMPGQEIPVKEGQRADFPGLAEMNDFEAAHPELFGGPDTNPRPLSSAPGYMVPDRHIKRGTPWTQPEMPQGGAAVPVLMGLAAGPGRADDYEWPLEAA
ncbi:MAG: hypothetical protein KJ621_08495 [Proteobacteria bacterium]|nr:hypothetical protein [Pseudomonadota bacterium]MBU1742071.1 hypothetical protein [Pseudomonadota bacterium]